MPLSRSFRGAAALAVVLLVPAGAFAQAVAEPEAAAPDTLTVSPEELTLTAGETARISATVLDSDGNEVEAEVLYLPLYGQFWNLEERTWGFNIFTVSPDGRVSTVRPGEYAVLVRVAGTARDASATDSDGGGYLQRRVPLTILPRPPASIALHAPGPFHAGTEVTLEATPLDDNGVSMLSRARIEGRARPPRGVNPYIRAPAPTCTYDGRTSRPIPTSPPVSVRTDRGATVPARDSDGRARRTRRPANPCTCRARSMTLILCGGLRKSGQSSTSRS